VRDCTRLVAMGLLDTTGRGSRLAGSLGSELLARSFATSRSEERGKLRDQIMRKVNTNLRAV